MENRASTISKPVVQCVNCILSTADEDTISFDSNGVCNYCNSYIRNYGSVEPLESRQKKLTVLVDRIKIESKGKKYDALLGLSGGVDSTYLAMMAKDLGLRVLLVHFDNGWNSELAVSNIEKVLNYTKFDLHTYVVNWDEFKDLQRSYILAGVIDWELPTDHGFYACLFETAKKFRIKHILTGHNYQTEAIMPKSMRWSKLDVANLLDIHKKFGHVKLKTMPLLSFWKYNYYKWILKTEFHNFLHYIDYNKEETKRNIIAILGWRDYGGKHYESIYTRFYQGYVLIKKYSKDKRKAHLSNLICSGQISRDEALVELAKPAYEEDVFKRDYQFFLKKMNFNENEFESIMNSKPVSHLEYKSYETGLYRKHEAIMIALKPFTRILKRILR
jgi:N-acetyl sugar amidotransferase